MLNIHKSKIIGILILSFLAFQVNAQLVVTDVSPFSRIGLGDFFPQNTITTAGMGGISAAYSSPYHANLQNPASFGHLRSTAFEVGAYVEKSDLKFNNEEQTFWNGNLSYLSLGFPLSNPLNEVLDRRQTKVKWGMNFALIPYTTVDYAIQTIEQNSVVDTTRNTFIGSGGTNKIVWSNGVQYENFTFGLSLGYLFGNIEYEREVNFLNLSNAYSDIFTDDLNVRGFIWDIGAIYQYHFGKDYEKGGKIAPDNTFTIGISGHAATNFKTENTKLRARVNDTFTSVVDTISYETNAEGSGKLPAEWNIGFMFRHKSKWLIGLDYSFADWSKYENEGKPEVLNESKRVAFGVQLTPDATSYNSYLKKSSYRVGFYYVDDPRAEDLKKYAFTFGVGLPITLPRQQTSFINLAFELGKYDSDTITDNFFRMSVGFTLNDNSWFFKRKFN